MGLVPTKLFIDGKQVGKNHQLYIDNTDIWLPYTCFRILLVLMVARYHDIAEGWIQTDRLYGSDDKRKSLAVKYISRMNKQVVNDLSGYDNWQLIEHSRHLGYRLNIEKDLIQYNTNSFYLLDLNEVEIKQSLAGEGVIPLG